MVEAAAYETRAVLQIASHWLLALVGEIYLDAMISLGTVGPVDGGVDWVVMVATGEDPAAADEVEIEKDLKRTCHGRQEAPV